ncbi:MAG: TonB-dependent receptor [Xanthomonadales bacterium]|nr:TonB-dependent receptor [Xanthomonadales bacterium]
MPTSIRCPLIVLALLAPATGLAVETPDSGERQNRQISEIVVTAKRREQAALDHAGNVKRLDLAEIQEVAPQHVHELMTRVAGAWIVRGSGQEHLTAIRSPVLSGAGSCGGFLMLEDGIPIRPSGFCNVNQMFELFTEQAQGVEVVRGPGSALYGSNALHGVVNALMPGPGSAPYVALEYGANDYARARLAMPLVRDSNWHLSAMYGRDGGFRDDSEHRQGKLHLKRRGQLAGGDLLLAFTATDLDQDTAGFINGFEAYRDEDISRMNFNPDAFRRAQSQRLYGIWRRQFNDFDLDLRPFVRHSDMQFLHHFAPGTPREKNGQTSAGLLASIAINQDARTVTAGVDLEWADAFLDQFQENPAMGSPQQVATRPQGQHYDYQVRQRSVAPFVQVEWLLDEAWTLAAGLRYEHMLYDYDNRMLDGNTRDDGTPCARGGCLYSRPADRSDRYDNWAPKFSASYRVNEQTRLYASLTRGFRAPQMTELYRLQNGQLVSDLDSEQLDALELGWRTERQRWRADISAYAMRKRDSVFRDAQGFNVSGARTNHAGIEVSLAWQPTHRFEALLDATHARHRYDFTFTPMRGERFIEGNDVDSAPRWLGSARLRFAPRPGLNLELQWVHLGDYFLDAENRFEYAGHDLLNLRGAWQFNDRTRVVLRLNNLADRRYADRADFAFGDFRYFPGRGRELFAEIRYTPKVSGN